MTTQKHLKRRIRERMSQTGERYAAARRNVVGTDGDPSGLLGEIEGLIVPTRGQVVATEPLAERCDQRCQANAPSSALVWGGGVSKLPATPAGARTSASRRNRNSS